MSDKKFLFEAIDAQRAELCSMADQIFDNPEYEGEEVFASGLLTDYLIANGFDVQMGVGGFKTAFRATYSHGEGGPVIGILCEYDALRNLGHGCGHHMQGPGCLGAAVALKNLDTDKSFQLVVYGTPAEETFGSKVQMIQNGCFKELDVALMMHGGPNTCTEKLQRYVPRTPRPCSARAGKGQKCIRCNAGGIPGRRILTGACAG